MTKYFHFDSDRYIDKDQLKFEDKTVQTEIIKNWFFENFENPAISTPFESREGGYIYIWGGPYNAREELENEFEDLVPQDVINIFIDELESESFEWCSKSTIFSLSDN